MKDCRKRVISNFMINLSNIQRNIMPTGNISYLNIPNKRKLHSNSITFNGKSTIKDAQGCRKETIYGRYHTYRDCMPEYYNI